MSEAVTDFKSIADEIRDAGISHVDIVRGDSYRNCSTAAVCLSRDGTVPMRVAATWQTLAKPQNHRFAYLFIERDEVGVGYDRAVRTLISDPKYKGVQYMLTLEADNIIPASALLMLMRTMHKGDYDAVGGLYFMKGPMATPMAFGRAGVVTEAGDLDMTPRDVTPALMAPENDDKARVLEVNGLACGCTLWNLDMFRDLPEPWFCTFTTQQGSIVQQQTQDLFFCGRAVAAGKRFAVDTRVRVGHLDLADGQVY